MSASGDAMFSGSVHFYDYRNQQDVDQVQASLHAAQVHDRQLHASQNVGEQDAVFHGMAAAVHGDPGVHVGYGHGTQAPPDGSMNPAFINNPYAYNFQVHQQVPAETFGLPRDFAHDAMDIQDDFGHMNDVGHFNQGVPQGYTFGGGVGGTVYGAPVGRYGHQVSNPQGPFMGQNEDFNGNWQHPYFKTAEPAEPIFEGDYRLFPSPKFSELDLVGGRPLLDTPALFEDAADFKEEEDEETPCPKRRKIGGGQQAKARKARPTARSAGVKKNGQIRKR